MAQSAYRQGDSERIVQRISIPPVTNGVVQLLWEVPTGFFGKWVFLHYILTLNTASAAFRAWFINVTAPDGADCGQIIPGIAAVGGASPPSNQPIHELMDSTLPVFFDEVFQGGAGVQPMWDYSGMSSIIWPDGFSFSLDASQMVAGDHFDNIQGMIELIPAESASINAPGAGPSASTLAYLLHTP